MKVRTKSLKPRSGTAREFTSPGSVQYVSVEFTDSILKESIHITDLLVEINGTWMEMSSAFALGELISDASYATFRAALTDSERQRGYILA